jgi:hypothetical protein
MTNSIQLAWKYFVPMILPGLWGSELALTRFVELIQ